jgi:hypothetical protein
MTPSNGSDLHSGHEAYGTALDLLSREDEVLLDLFTQLSESRGRMVDDRARYGDLAKALVRQVAIREAALVDICRALEHLETLESLTQRMQSEMESRRGAMDDLERMSRGIHGINLNQGQDFDGALIAFETIVLPQIAWDRAELIPQVHDTLSARERQHELHSDSYLARHAPTHVHPAGSRWFERAPVISRLLALFGHLRDYPTAVPDHLKPGAAVNRDAPPASGDEPRTTPQEGENQDHGLGPPS